MFSTKRPKRGETEEDLIKEQNQFISKNKVQKVKNNTNDDNCVQNSDNEENKLSDNHDLPHIVCNIVEKNVNSFDFKPINKFNKSLNGFPKAMRRSDDLVPKSGKSLFALQMNKNKGNNNEYKECEERVESVVIGNGLGVKEWKKEIMNIRKQNDLLINSLDTNEILEMRSELMTKLNKNTIDFIRNKRSVDKRKVKSEHSIDVEMSETNEQEIKAKLSLNENDLPIKPNEVKDNKWLNMDVIEKDKLLWMSDLPQKSSEVSKSARFDFEGSLVDNSEEIDVHLGLHHHGLEQSSAGYTIQELYDFIQSNFSAQKVIGLEVFAKIFSKAYHGLFDNCFNQNIIVQLLKSSSLVLITRKCMDDNNETVWKTAIYSLQTILCNTIVDELYLDKGFVLLNHDFNIDKSVKDLKPSYDSSIKCEELTDEQLAQIDVIKCLVQRTALIERIRFLFDFNKSQLDSKSVNNLLDILIRISRHSFDSRQAIIECPHLLETIIKNFIPVSISFSTNVIFNKPNPKALKLIRILTDSNSETTLRIISDHFQVIEALKVYLTLNPENCENASEILQLSIESLRVWLNIISYKIGVAHFLDMFPIVVKQLQFCQTLHPISHTNYFDFQYASTLISLVKCLVKESSSFSAFNELIRVILLKWLSILKNESVIPNFDANVMILSAIEFLRVAEIDSKLLHDIAFQVMNSTTFMNKLINSVIDNSNLVQLNAQNQGNLRDSPNLPSYGSIYFQNLDNIAILNNKSSVCLLSAIVHILRTLSDESLTIKLKCIQEYVSRVANNLKFNIKLNLFDCYELNLMNEICLLFSTLSAIETEDIHCFLNISILMICFTKNDRLKHNLLNSVIFNKSMHSNKLTESIAKLSLDSDVKISETHETLESFDSIKAVYKKFSNFDCTHWVFDPIIKSLKLEKPVAKEVDDCLLFIYLIVTNHKNYLTQMFSSNSVAFCLISSVFLIPKEVFFELSVQRLLHNLLLKLLSDGINCQKEDRVPHFETVGDFFSQFLNQFESVSYGNKLFINYLLVFCQRKCSPLFRNRLLSDNLTALRVVNINFNEILLPLDNLLFPIENDSDTLESYLKALLCGELNPKHSPVLYLMAIHHLNHALFRTTKVLSAENQQRFNKLIRSVHNSRNNELKMHLSTYSHFDEKQMYGLCLK